MQHLELRRAQRLPQEPAREARELALEQRQRRVAERVKAVPAADLQIAELRMLEAFPRAMRRAAELVLAPAKKLEIVLDRVIAKPVDELVVGDARLAHRRPDLDHPREESEVLVDPVERAA